MRNVRYLRVIHDIFFIMMVTDGTAPNGVVASGAAMMNIITPNIFGVGT